MLPDWEYRSRDAEPDQEKVFEYTVPSFGRWGGPPGLRPTPSSAFSFGT